MKIICFGDSNTYGYDPRGYFGGRYDNPWPEILAEKLCCTVLNWGENGREIPVLEEIQEHFDMMLANQSPIDLLIVMLGSNDLLQGNHVSDVVERMKFFLNPVDLDASKILLIGPPPMHLGEWVPDENLIHASNELNKEYRALAKRFDIRFADAGQWNLPLAYDGVHLTESGHKLFAENLYKELIVP